MRLIHAQRFLLGQQDILSEFISDEETPPYAILSHTWDKEELVFNDVKQMELLLRVSSGQDSTGTECSSYLPSAGLYDSTNSNIDKASTERSLQSFKSKLGYIKVENACKQALDDFYDYLWVDTCCIDKSSSAELQEAINSMWQWYQDSEICYVYLGDFEGCSACEQSSVKHTKTAHLPDLRRCRWFWRGWTLQELLAPRQVVFFAKDWDRVGHLSDLAELVSDVTEIDVKILQKQQLIFESSIATRMSWAAGRKTSRIEDRAYSLLGLMQVNLPMLYGEKSRAFIRLQEEILRTSTDQSILAWGTRSLSVTDPLQHEALLATSPDDFAGSACSSDRPLGNDVDDALEMTSAGLRISTWLLSTEEESRFSMVLNCAASVNLPGRLRVLSVRESPSPFAPDTQRRLYVNAASLVKSFSINDEQGGLFAPESRIEYVDASAVRKAKYQSITISRGVDAPSSSSSPGMIANGIRLRLPESLQILDALPKSWLHARGGGKLQSLPKALNPPRFKVTKWDGAFQLRHREGQIVVLLLCVEQRDPREQPDYHVGFHNGEDWDTWTGDERTLTMKRWRMEEEWTIAGETFAVRYPVIHSFKPTFNVYRK